MSAIDKFLKNNRKWVDSLKKTDPNFFNELSKEQKPEYLWIGCSDSRVLTNHVIDMRPGEVFIHRNIANQIVHSDTNCMSVIQFAVNILKVKHIIICGHYDCGGITASLGEKYGGVIDQWLDHVRKVFQKHKNVFKTLKKNDTIDRLCEFNVVEQVTNMCNTEFVKNAWENEQPLSIHGVIYDLKTGLLHDLDQCTSLEELSKRN